MNKYFVYLYIPIGLGLDFYSTYWSAKGDINSIIELHFLSSVFGKGFEALGFFFFIECLILLGLCRYYFHKKAVDSKKSATAPKYKILKDRRRKAFTAKQFIDSTPVIALIISTSHLVFSLNNFLLGFYLRDSSSKLVTAYIDFVHLGGRIYLVHLSIIIIAILIMYVFSKKKNLRC